MRYALPLIRGVDGDCIAGTEQCSQETMNSQGLKSSGCFHYNANFQAASETLNFNFLWEPDLPVRFLALLAPSQYKCETTKQNKINNCLQSLEERREWERCSEYGSLCQSWSSHGPSRKEDATFNLSHREDLIDGIGYISDRKAERPQEEDDAIGDYQQQEAAHILSSQGQLPRTCFGTQNPRRPCSGSWSHPDASGGDEVGVLYPFIWGHIILQFTNCVSQSLLKILLSLTTSQGPLRGLLVTSLFILFLGNELHTRGFAFYSKVVDSEISPSQNSPELWTPIVKLLLYIFTQISSKCIKLKNYKQNNLLLLPVYHCSPVQVNGTLVYPAAYTETWMSALRLPPPEGEKHHSSSSYHTWNFPTSLHLMACNFWFKPS